MKLFLFHVLLILSIINIALFAEEAKFFDLSIDSAYTEGTGYGYDLNTKPQSESNSKPAYFSIKVDDGNYKVTFEIGSDKYDADTTIRAEGRRLLIHNLSTQKGEFKTFTFVVHKRSPKIDQQNSVRLKDRELNYLNWDEKLTFEFNGNAPALKSLKVEKDSKAVTLFLCGDSTVVDQEGEPWASWGQMIPRWFDENVCIANYAESGETSTFRTYIAKAKLKGANSIILSPTARRWFNGETVTNTHGDYPTAARQVAENEGVPFIDITQMTTDMLEAYGSSDSTKFYVHYPAGVYSEAALKDDTHFNNFGAYEVAKCVVMGLKQIESPLISHLLADWKDFNPKEPDDWQDFIWVPSPSIEYTVGTTSSHCPPRFFLLLCFLYNLYLL